MFSSVIVFFIFELFKVQGNRIFGRRFIKRLYDIILRNGSSFKKILKNIGIRVNR